MVMWLTQRDAKVDQNNAKFSRPDLAHCALEPGVLTSSPVTLARQPPGGSPSENPAVHVRTRQRSGHCCHVRIPVIPGADCAT
ncbi:Hypp1199 [Branchiostoma lanceolatum]|uniref:Hypp1199 protein n=1 Tax=Branchiostoma lanceolatum TaxID=7740 RepID=A0A8J9ZHI2_BRALA|nr:Hypp1199 [Branchiostoma lanceolatum]